MHKILASTILLAAVMLGLGACTDGNTGWPPVSYTGNIASPGGGLAPAHGPWKE